MELTTPPSQVICRSRPAPMQKTAVQGYVGDTVDISTRVHAMLEGMDDINFLAFATCGRSGFAFSLSQHLSI